MVKKMVVFIFIILTIAVVIISAFVGNRTIQRTTVKKENSLASFSMKFQMKDLRDDFNQILGGCSKREAGKIQHLLKKKDEYEVYVKFSMLADNVRVDAEKTIGGEPGIINFSQTKTFTFEIESIIFLTITDENDEFSMGVDRMFFEKTMNRKGVVKVSFVKPES